MKILLDIFIIFLRLINLLAATFLCSLFTDGMLHIGLGNAKWVVYELGLQLGFTPTTEYIYDEWWVKLYPWCLYLTVLISILLFRWLLKKIIRKRW